MNITQHLQIRYDEEEGDGNIGDDDDDMMRKHWQDCF